MGALRAFVSGYSEAAWALYQSVMGSACEVYERWVKTW
jgi:thiaminase